MTGREKTLRLKAEALYWLRFEKNYNMVCTELSQGMFIADVFGLGPRLPSPNWSLEIEVKITKADLNNDFVKKAFKHEMNTAALPSVPNYFYFMVPQELVTYAIDLVGIKNPSYGVMTVNAFGGVKVAKSPTKLHSLRPSQKMFENVVRRMGNEIVTLTQKQARLELNDKTADRSEAIGEAGEEPISGED